MLEFDSHSFSEGNLQSFTRQQLLDGHAGALRDVENLLARLADTKVVTRFELFDKLRIELA